MIRHSCHTETVCHADVQIVINARRVSRHRFRSIVKLWTRSERSTHGLLAKPGWRAPVVSECLRWLPGRTLTNGYC